MEKDIFNILIEGIQKHPYENFYNQPGKIRHSGVAIILRINPQCINDQNFYKRYCQYIPNKINDPQQCITRHQIVQQLLDDKDFLNTQNLLQMIFIQRAINPKDIHSGQLAFPGGQCDGNENDFQASLREVKEEIGIDLLSIPAMYLGKLPRSFYVRKTRNQENLYTSVHFFVILSEKDIQFQLSKDEVADVKWVSFSSLTAPQKSQFQKLKVPQGNYYINYVPYFVRGLASNALKHYEFGEYQSLDIGMKNVLWGMTFFIIVYINSLILYNNEKRQKPFDLSNTQYFLDNSSYFRVQFQQQYMLGSIFSFMLRKIYIKSRVQQFSYRNQIEGKNKNKSLYEIPIYCCAILISIAAFYYFKKPKISL